MALNSKIPKVKVQDAWRNHIDSINLVGPKNRPKYDIIVVGSGLAGASAAASLGAMGYKVKLFCFQDSPGRAHSIAAQGGINASKNYRNDGDSTWRLFYDTQKGGDFRAREANVYRLAEVSTQIIDQCVAQGVPLAREYGGNLANRSFGGVLVERTFYARGQTGQQLLLGAYQALEEQVSKGQVIQFPRTEMQDIVVIDGRCRGIVVRDLKTGQIETHDADAVVLATGGYCNVYHRSTNAVNCNVTAAWRAHKRGAFFANPSFVQIHPTCIPVSGDHQSKLTLMSESLRNDGRIWVPRKKGDDRKPTDIPDNERYYYLEERYPSFGNLVPRDVASRAAKKVCDEGYGIGSTGYGVYLDFRDAINAQGKDAIKSKYGNLFDMYKDITAEDPYTTPFKIYPAPHYTMGGLWVDYNLMTNIPGLYAIGEANFSDHGANRLGASSLMQCLADGYFILPETIGDYLRDIYQQKVDPKHPAFTEMANEVETKIDSLMNIQGTRTPLSFQKELGEIMWNSCGMSRNETDLRDALKAISNLRKEFWSNLKVAGNKNSFNQSLERAGRVADFLEFAELMCQDALDRNESCGCHLREEYVHEDGEAKRNDDDYSYVAAWEWEGIFAGDTAHKLHKEFLNHEAIKPSTRSYK